MNECVQLVANIKLALHLDGKFSNILSLLLYVMVKLFKLRFLNLHQRLEVYSGPEYA